MSMTVRDLAKGPALGDAVDRWSHNKRVMWIVLGACAVVFVAIGIWTPGLALLLLAILLLVGVAVAIYNRKQVRGQGRLSHHRGRRR